MDGRTDPTPKYHAIRAFTLLSCGTRGYPRLFPPFDTRPNGNFVV